MAQPYGQPAPGQPQQPQGGAAGGPPVAWSNDFWDCFSPADLCCMTCVCVLLPFRWPDDGSLLLGLFPSGMLTAIDR
jgi:hypothetical protein